jgi:hypothetical protein
LTEKSQKLRHEAASSANANSVAEANLVQSLAKFKKLNQHLVAADFDNQRLSKEREAFKKAVDEKMG